MDNLLWSLGVLLLTPVVILGMLAVVAIYEGAVKIWTWIRK